MPKTELQRICDRAGIETEPADRHPLGFMDRAGEVHLPLDAVVDLAKAFAAAEPQTLVRYIDDEEEALRLRGDVSGDRWYHDYLRQKGARHALALRWAGLEPEPALFVKR